MLILFQTKVIFRQQEKSCIRKAICLSHTLFKCHPQIKHFANSERPSISISITIKYILRSVKWCKNKATGYNDTASFGEQKKFSISHMLNMQIHPKRSTKTARKASTISMQDPSQKSPDKYEAKSRYADGDRGRTKTVIFCILQYQTPSLSNFRFQPSVLLLFLSLPGMLLLASWPRLSRPGLGLIANASSLSKSKPRLAFALCRVLVE